MLFRAFSAISCRRYAIALLSAMVFSGQVLAKSPPAEILSMGEAVGLSVDFRDWLVQHGYHGYDFARDDLGKGGSFGGKAHSDEALVHQPVIFVHGNSDRALGGTPLGWNTQIGFFLDQGYRAAELYATTWGPADSALAAQQYHSRAYLVRLRTFIEAVLQYTGAAKVDIVAHSMGVTLARKAVLGGKGVDHNDASYDLGVSLADRVDTFVGIAGANLGLAVCVGASVVPSCNKVDGFYPGGLRWGWPAPESRFLESLNENSEREGEFLYSIWSPNDEVVGFGNLVYGKITGRIPQQTDEIVLTGSNVSHFDTKNETAALVFDLVVHHRMPE